MERAGEDCQSTARGMFLVATNSESPFARGHDDNLPRELNDGWNVSGEILANSLRDLNEVDKSRSMRFLRQFSQSNATNDVD